MCSDPLPLAHTCLGRSTELARIGKQGIFSGISGWRDGLRPEMLQITGDSAKNQPMQTNRPREPPVEAWADRGATEAG